MNGFFITGTDTGIGKTLVSTALMAAAPEHTHYWKPIQTGAPDDSDCDYVAQYSGIARSRILDEGFRYKEPASPHHAAALENDTITLAPLLDIAQTQGATSSMWIVEGAGGLLVPLSETLLMTDLIKALGLCVILVSSTRLGTINHTLLSADYLKTSQIDTAGIIMNGATDNAALTGIGSHCQFPIIGQVPHLDALSTQTMRTVGKTLWQQPALAMRMS